MGTDFMERLQALRTVLERPLTICSGYRCDAHNKRVGGGPAHALGKAADIACSGETARLVIDTATDFSGVGIQQRGDHATRFIHLDMLADGEGGAPRPWIWSY